MSKERSEESLTMTENIANIKLFGHFVTVKMRGHFSENIDTSYIKAYACPTSQSFQEHHCKPMILGLP